MQVCGLIVRLEHPGVVHTTDQVSDTHCSPLTGASRCIHELDVVTNERRVTELAQVTDPAEDSFGRDWQALYRNCSDALA